MKKNFKSVVATLLSVALLAVIPTPVSANQDASGRYYTEYRGSARPEWLNATDEVEADPTDENQAALRDWFIYPSKAEDRSSDLRRYEKGLSYIVETRLMDFDTAAYNKVVVTNGHRRTVKDLARDLVDVEEYLPQYTATQVIDEIMKHAEDGYRERSRPRLAELSIVRFMRWICVIDGTPARIVKVFRESEDRYGYILAVADTVEHRFLYSDPVGAVRSGSLGKNLWLSEQDYSRNFSFIEYHEEANDSINGLEEYGLRPIEIPAEDRYDSVKFTLTRNGKRSTHYIQAIVEKGEQLIPFRDVLGMLDGTDGECWVRGDANSALEFGPGKYYPGQNWTSEHAVKIDKEAQAYLADYVLYSPSGDKDGPFEKVDCDVVTIGDTRFVRPYDVVDIIGMPHLITGFSLNLI